MRSGLWLPLFEELADPGAVARLAAEAEERGWHGVFVWDHVRWREPIREVADPWIMLTAIATATERVMLASIFHEDLSLCEVEAELARSATVGMVDGPHCPDRLAGLCAVG
jgi:hypothetical protein